MINHEQVQKSRLGRLLVNRGYITESQLDQALKMQAEQTKLLGEVLVEQGWLSQKTLNRVLRRQQRYRLAATIVTAAVAPLQPMLTYAASPNTVAANDASIPIPAHQMASLSGLQALDDEALDEVAAQGFSPAMAGLAMTQNLNTTANSTYHRYDEDKSFDDDDERHEMLAQNLSDSVLSSVGLGPISGMLDSELTITGVEYAENLPQFEITSDGGFKIYMPSSIEQIAMENIRVKGDDSGNVFGSIYMSNIQYGEGSSMTIRPKGTGFGAGVF